MANFHLLFALIVACAFGTQASDCHPFPSSVIEFSSGFKQPEPPLLKAEYETNFIQHKWYDSHIANRSVKTILI